MFLTRTMALALVAFLPPIISADVVTLVGENAYLAVDPTYDITSFSSLPATASYTSPAPCPASQSSSATATANLTTVSAQASINLESNGVAGCYTGQQQVATAIASLTLHLNQPVYLSESVTVNYTSSSPPESYPFPYADQSLQFFDSQGNALGACSFYVGYDGPATANGTKSCSTGLVLADTSDSTVILNNYFQPEVLEVGSVPNAIGYTATMQGTATLGSLNIYDLNQNLIETIDLNSLVTAPEPSGVALLALGLAAIGLGRAKKRGA